MNVLPASIEAHLLEAGFTSTEVLLLKKLMEEDGLTLRQLATRMGKSTGVLDQAMKKLLRKEIVRKEYINGGYKFTLISLEMVTRWMAKDMKQKSEMLQRKHENFESFVSTLKIDKKRPEMQYFDGEEGMKQAYMLMLSQGKEMLQYVPVLCSADDDPLRDFKVQYFRERRSRGIFSRVIAHDTTLGRRYRTRDPFEYRQTLLVPEDQYPFNFEKIIVGDTIMCINPVEKRACFIKYPEMASMEKTLFDGIWKAETQPATVTSEGSQEPNPLPLIQSVPMKTQVLSRLREFFLSRESIVSFVIFALISAGVTFAIYKNDVNLNLERLREKVVSIAATAALQFDVNDLEQLRTLKDIEKPEYAKVIKQLNDIRYQNQWVKYTYMLRYTGNQQLFEFVADSNAIDPFVHVDENDDGVINDADHLPVPGEIYDASNTPNSNAALERPIGFNAGTDQWGTFISGWAPIKDINGHTVAVLGVDVLANQLEQLTLSPLVMLGYFLGLFFLFVMARIAAFNRSLYAQAWDALRETSWLTYSVLVIVFICASVSGYFYLSSLNLQRMKEQALAIAVSGAGRFSAADLQELQTEGDAQKPVWTKVVNELKTLRLNNSDIVFAYLIRKDPSDSTKLTFISDSHSLNPYANADADPTNNVDVDEDGEINLHDILQWPGQPYPDPPTEAFRGFESATTSAAIYSDQWGKMLSGYAPIFDENQNTVAVLVIDVRAEKLSELNLSTFGIPFIFLLLILFIFISTKLVLFNGSYLKKLWHIFEMRRVLISLLLCAEISFFATLGVYYYMLNNIKADMGERLMSIVVTAAPQISVRDLEQLHLPRDMKKDAYQRVFNILNTIRKQNYMLKYVYILRSIQPPNLWEFVADADSNYNIPFYSDSNRDGKLESDVDENVAPGVAYFEPSNMGLSNALQNPTHSIDFFADQWGMWLSGFAPIKDANGKTVAVLGLDTDVGDFYKLLKARFVPWLWFTGLFSGILVIKILQKK